MNQKCYQILPDKYNWTDSRITCQNLHAGADLAILTEAQDLRNAYEYINQYGKNLL